MKYILITQTEEMAEAARSPKAFPPGDEVLVFSAWKDALDASQDTDLMFVDMVATLDEQHKAAGYERFAEAKMHHPVAGGVPLVLIAPEDSYELDYIPGWPDFVFAHIRRPVDEKIFRRASTWV